MSKKSCAFSWPAWLIISFLETNTGHARMWKTKWIIEIVGTESISLAIILLYIFMLNWKALQIWWRRWILRRGLWNGQPPAGKREQWNHHWASGQTPHFKLSAMGHQSLLPHSSSAVQHSRPARSKREDQLWQQLIPIGWLPMTPVSKQLKVLQWRLPASWGKQIY